jgi:hypothetical protein
LDYITGGEFSARTDYKLDNFAMHTKGKNIGTFHGKFTKWIASGSATKVSEFLTLQDLTYNTDNNLLAVVHE